VGYSDTLCSPSVSSHLCWQVSITDTGFREREDKAQFTNTFLWKQKDVMTETVCRNWISCCHLFSHKKMSTSRMLLMGNKNQKLKPKPLNIFSLLLYC